MHNRPDESIWSQRDKLLDYMQSNSKKILLSLLTALSMGVAVYTYNKLTKSNDDNLDTKEQYWSDPVFKQKDLDYHHEIISEDIHLIRDAKGSFYVVKDGDNLSTIRHKLMKIPEFAYLARQEYDPSIARNKTKSFNIPASELVPGLYIPIPMDDNLRHIYPYEFAKYAEQALQEMYQDKKYGQTIQDLLQKIDENDLIAAMVSFARCETAQDHTNFSDAIGTTAYHRWEKKYKVFSFSPFHILGERNKDDSPGPGLQARLDLGISEMQTYHPINACKWFLAYCCRKTNHHPEKILDLSNGTKRAAKLYNGLGYRSNKYDQKLATNYKYIKELLEDDITYYNIKELSNYGWEYKGINSKKKNIFRYKIPTNSLGDDIRQDIVNTIHNIHPNSNLKASDIDITDADGKMYKETHKYKLGQKVYVGLP